MSWAARVYLGIVIGIGLGTVGWAGAHLPSTDWSRFAFYLAVSAVASVFKIRLPGVEITTSVGFFFYLLSAVELGFERSVVIAGACAAVQSYWRPRHKPSPAQILFSISMIAVSTGGAALLFHSPILEGLEFLMRAGSAAVLFFLVNTACLAGVLYLVESRESFSSWQSSLPWLFPYYLLAAVAVGIFHAAATWLGWQSAMFLLPVAYLVFHSFQLYQERLEAKRKSAEEIAAVHMRTIEALALAIEAKDETTHEHLGRVQVYALEIGRELGLTEPQMEALRAAAILHDIGKLAVPEQIINKPGRLTPEEFNKMKIHPVVGAEILETVQFPYPVAPMVRSHHEKWDGSGYPDGLKGVDIPVGARILGVVDTLDALASDRQYRRALPLNEAMEVVKRQSGVSFDPQIVDILARRYVDLEQKARQENAKHAKLSIGIRIERGAAPAAGFEEARLEPQSAHTVTLSSLDELAPLLTTIQTNASSLGREGILSLLANRIDRLIPSEGLVFYGIEQDALQSVYVSGAQAKLLQSLSIRVGQGLSGWVAENQRSILNGNPAVEPCSLPERSALSLLRSALAVPLVDGVSPGSPIAGVLSVYRAGRDAFSASELMLLEMAARQITAAFQCALTLPQSSACGGAWSSLIRQMDETAGQCASEGRPMSIAVAGLNGIEQLSRQYGSDASERFIRAFVEKIDAPVVSQTGHSDFALLLPGLADSDARAWAQRARDAATATSLEAFGQDLVSLNVGVSTAVADKPDSSRLLAEAHRDMTLSGARQ